MVGSAHFHLSLVFGLLLILVVSGCDVEERRAGDAEAVVGALTDALNSRDEDAVVALYRDDYRSEQPTHPDQTFEGTEHVRQIWSRFFDTLPNFRAELLRSAERGNEVWTEWEWTGSDRTDDTPHQYRGVIIFGIEQGRIAWSRQYMEPVD